MEKFYFKSKIGILAGEYENDTLFSLKFTDKFIENKDNTFSNNLKSQLDEYFLGKRKKFEIKINPVGSEFQKKVWMELSKIPYGKTKTYSEIAFNTGNKNAQRAVGSACNKNPLLIIIPCHRVVLKNEKIGGFAFGEDIKRALLELEKSQTKSR